MRRSVLLIAVLVFAVSLLPAGEGSAGMVLKAKGKFDSTVLAHPKIVQGDCWTWSGIETCEEFIRVLVPGLDILQGKNVAVEAKVQMNSSSPQLVNAWIIPATGLYFNEGHVLFRVGEIKGGVFVPSITGARRFAIFVEE